MHNDRANVHAQVMVRNGDGDGQRLRCTGDVPETITLPRMSTARATVNAATRMDMAHEQPHNYALAKSSYMRQPLHTLPLACNVFA